MLGSEDIAAAASQHTKLEKLLCSVSEDHPKVSGVRDDGGSYSLTFKSEASAEEKTAANSALLALLAGELDELGLEKTSRKAAVDVRSEVLAEEGVFAHQGAEFSTSDESRGKIVALFESLDLVVFPVRLTTADGGNYYAPDLADLTALRQAFFVRVATWLEQGAAIKLSIDAAADLAALDLPPCVDDRS